MSKRPPPEKVTLDEWLAENVSPELYRALDSHLELLTLNLLVGHKKHHFALTAADGDFVVQARLPMPKSLKPRITTLLAMVVSALVTFMLTHLRPP